MTTRLTVAAAADGGVFVISQVAPSGSWTDWQPLAAPAGVGVRFSVPSLAANRDGRLEVFAPGSSGGRPGLWQRTQSVRYGGWAAWNRIPDPPGVSWTQVGVAVRGGQDGRLELFAVNGEGRQSPLNSPANDVWHRWQTAVNGGWSGWHAAGQPPDAQQLGLLLAINGDRRLDLVSGVATPGAATEQWHCWHRPQLHPNDGWAGWQQLPDAPNPHDPLQVAGIGSNADGRLELFAVHGSDSTLWHTWQQTAGGAWAPWFSSGKPAARYVTGFGFAVGRNADGRLEVFTTAASDVFSDTQEVWHVWQTAPNGTWSPWSSLGTPGGGLGTEGGELAVGSSDDGRMELFAACRDGNLWHCWQRAVNAGWSPWMSHGKPAGTTSVAFPALCES